ncbi:MAG: hypothetical protein H6Q13_2147 [Bacteroidetes bacterium]|nr:hypothetical protein [Bacteroidota bacterium]
MKKFLLKQSLVLLSVLFASVTMISCSNDSELGSVDTRATQSITVSGVITGTNNWSGTVYLDGKVFLVDGTLNIAAGTTIIGKAKSTPQEASALIITRTGTINADGTNGTIIFKGETDTKGSWGGLVVLGTAAINQTTTKEIEGITNAQAAGNDISYGTSVQGKTQTEINAINNVSSGTLKYVRVENAGASIADANELNAFTFGGVGALTTVDHCQAYHGADDAFEFFGGAVNCTYLVATACDDDAFDFDFGYIGKIQFAVATIDPSLTYSSDPNGIECDNDGSSSALTPFTHPVLSNLTIVGTSTGATSAGVALKSAADFRRNCRFTLVNSVLYGFPRGILKETANTTYTLENNVVCAVPSTGINFSADKTATTTFTPSSTNSGLTSYSDIGLTSPWGGYKNATALRPNASPANSGADFTSLDSWFTTTTYKGAIALTGTANWLTQTWIK